MDFSDSTDESAEYFGSLNGSPKLRMSAEDYSPDVEIAFSEDEVVLSALGSDETEFAAGPKIRQKRRNKEQVKRYRRNIEAMRLERAVKSSFLLDFDKDDDL